MKLIRFLVLAFLCFSAELVAAQASHPPFSYGPTLPTTCTPSVGSYRNLFWKTTAPIGLHECLITDIWTRAGGTASDYPIQGAGTHLLAITCTTAEGRIPRWDTADNRWECGDPSQISTDVTGANRSYTDADRGLEICRTHSAAMTDTIPIATSIVTSNFWAIKNCDTADPLTVNITTSLMNLNGNASVTSVILTPGQKLKVIAKGTTYDGEVTQAKRSISFEGASADGAIGSFALDKCPSLTAGAATVINGTNVGRTVLALDAATDEGGCGSFLLPPDWAGTIDLEVEASAAEAGTNVARLSMAGICVGAGETFDPAFNTAQTFAWTNTGSGQRVTVTQAALTTTGCLPTERYYFKFFRDGDGTSGTDSVAVDLSVIAVRLRY